MNQKIFIFGMLLLAVTFISNAQSVGIASTAITPDPSSMLDIQASNKGLLIPRVALTATNAAGPVTAPATSVLVYNTAIAGPVGTNVYPGYYYNAGTPAAPNWVRLLGGKEAWLLTGNNGTNVATNWLGTNDAMDFATRTNNAERMRILSAGNILMNRTTALYATDMLEVQGNASFPDAINGYTNQAGGNGVYGSNNAATGAGGGCGVFGASAQTGAAGVWGSGGNYTRGLWGTTNSASYAGLQAQNANGNGDAIFAVNTDVIGNKTGSAILAWSNQTGGSTIIAGLQSTLYYPNAAVSAVNDVPTGATSGVIGDAFSASGTGLFGLNSAAVGAGIGVGVFGQTAQSAGAGVVGVTTNAAGSAIQAINNGGVGTNAGDAVYAFTEQSRGMGVFATNGHPNGTAILAAGNNVTGYYLPGGSGGAFTGINTGAYGYELDSLTAGTGVATGYNGVFGKAHSRRNTPSATIPLYHFGVYGEYRDKGNRDGTNSGGVLGYGENGGSGAWGSLGYLSSGGALFGGYFSNTTGTGAGKSASGPSTSIGFGSEGGFMGGHVYGSEYGLVTAGNRAGMLVEGETYSTGYYAVLNQTEEGDYIPSYATVSSKPTIYASGTGTMNGGTATIVFDKAFSELVSSESPVIITVTPMGPSQGLYVESVNNAEFVVKENGSNELKVAKGTLKFSWIAMATVKNQENPVVPSELQTNEFHTNMNGFMQNERSTADQQYYMWWDGSNMRYTEPDFEISFTPAQSKGSAAKEKRVYETKEINQFPEKTNTAVQEKEFKIQQIEKNKINNE